MKRVRAIPCLVLALMMALTVSAVSGEKMQSVSGAGSASASSVDQTPPPGMILVPEGKVFFGMTKDQLKELEGDLRVKFDLKDRDTRLNWELIGKRHQQQIVPAFYMDEHEVTNRAYKAFTDATGYTKPSHWENGEPAEATLDLPVVNVRYIDAVAYAKWAGKRLPTELQWERAARGDEARWYPWGNFWDDRQRLFAAGQRKEAGRAKTDDHCNALEAQQAELRPGGKFPKGNSPFGIADMAGNVWEWTSSWIGPHEGGYEDIAGEYGKVVKGGSFLNSKLYQRSTARLYMDPGESQNALGFRCVKSLEPGVDRLHAAAADLDPTLPEGTKISVRDHGVAREVSKYDEKHGHSLGAKIIGFCPIEKIAAPDPRGLTRLARKDPANMHPLGIISTSYKVKNLGIDAGDYAVFFQGANESEFKAWKKKKDEEKAAKAKAKDEKASEGDAAKDIAVDDEDIEFPPHSKVDRLVFQDENGDMVAEIPEPKIYQGSDDSVTSKLIPNDTGMMLRMVIASQFGRKVLVVEVPFEMDK